jgi:glycogen phosphorylase
MATAATATSVPERRPSVSRDRRPSMSAPISDLQGPVGPGFTRPKHKRTATGFGPSEIKAVESTIPEPQRAAYEPMVEPLPTRAFADI